MILDTDILIDIERGVESAIQWYAQLTPMPSISGYSALELLTGCRDKKDTIKTRMFLRTIQHHWPSALSCDLAVDIYAIYRLRQGMDLRDSLIAATAIEQDSVLATFNQRHYQGIPGLKLLSSPYQRHTP